MICGIGIDSVDIKRFNHWKDYNVIQLKRIFTDEEITYCTSVPALMLERLAVRFAAKEAFFKAWSSYAPSCTLPLMSMCPAISIRHTDNGAPQLDIKWDYLYAHSAPITHEMLSAHIALTHTGTTATACVILEKHGDSESNNNPLTQSPDAIMNEIELYLDEDEDIPDDDSEEDIDHDDEDSLEISDHNSLWFTQQAQNLHILKNRSENRLDMGTKSVTISNNN